MHNKRKRLTNLAWSQFIGFYVQQTKSEVLLEYKLVCERLFRLALVSRRSRLKLKTKFVDGNFRLIRRCVFGFDYFGIQLTDQTSNRKKTLTVFSPTETTRLFKLLDLGLQ
ncbi:hypothetical protein M3Y96_01251900 [Aphelenchoides besseyi]|nr:hypothetical protein M3Y96_01251900 [Aphelenchoides besseyi]